MFHKEGYQIIGITVAICLLINILGLVWVDMAWGNGLIFGATLVLMVLILQFFRNPKRHTNTDNHQIIAPVDGKVVIVKEVYEKEYFKDKRLQVSVFMSPLNVHVTRYPLSGKILFSKYHPGKYLVAWHPKSSEKNERTTVVVDNPVFGKVLYRQIAGAVARRIVNYAKVGQTAIQGKDSGFIKFGSRLDVFLPLDTKVKVNVNQKVRGGETILAKINEYGQK